MAIDLPSHRELAALVFNRLLTHVPSNDLHVSLLRALGAQIGANVFLFGGSEFVHPWSLRIDGN